MKAGVLFNIILCLGFEISLGYQFVISSSPNSVTWYLILYSIIFPFVIDLRGLLWQGKEPTAVRGIISVVTTGIRKNREEEYYTGKFYLYNIVATTLFTGYMYIVY